MQIAMIRLRNISMDYGDGHEVLKHISLDLAPGSFHFLTGPSGAGKSSLLNLLSCAHRPSAGSISMFDTDITRLPHQELPRVRRKIGSVFQDFRLLEHLTVAENIGLPLRVVGEPSSLIDTKAKELLSWVGLADYADAYPKTLSGGQKQRAAIARAVINNPNLLLADEPTGNLDSRAGESVMELLHELYMNGSTICIVTHDPRYARHAHRQVYLFDGRVVSEPPLELVGAK